MKLLCREKMCGVDRNGCPIENVRSCRECQFLHHDCVQVDSWTDKVELQIAAEVVQEAVMAAVARRMRETY
jgi:hypothetical protein